MILLHNKLVDKDCQIESFDFYEVWGGGGLAVINSSRGMSTAMWVFPEVNMACCKGRPCASRESKITLQIGAKSIGSVCSGLVELWFFISYQD